MIDCGSSEPSWQQIARSGRDLIAEIDATPSEPGGVAFWWLGQMSFVVKMGGYVFYIDPYLTPRHTRLFPPLLTPDQVTNADYILGSHAHSDHIDRPSLPGMALASPKAALVCSFVARQVVREAGWPEGRIIALDDGRCVDDGSVRISAIAAQHEFFHRDDDLGYPHLCYIIEVGGATVFHAGDTLWYDGMVAKLQPWQFDVAFLPINGRDAARYARRCMGNMTFQEAVDLAGALQPRLAVPGHFDMFHGNTEDPTKFTDYLRAKYPSLDCWLGAHGERVILPPAGHQFHRQGE